jgi:hypothetical protein
LSAITRRDVAALQSGAHRSNLQLRAGSTAGNDAGLADALPRQAQCERIELLARDARRVRPRPRPDEAALVQPARGQPHTDAVTHQHLEAAGPAVRKAVGVVRLRRAEHLDHLGQDGLAARRHVQGSGGICL